MKQIEGGVCAAAGFKAAGVHCGIRKNQSKRDLGLIVSDCKASAAAVYTTNLVKGAPLLVTKEHLADGTAQAILCNSGNANTCNADGPQIANAMCQLAADQLGLAPEDVAIASTGVIGQPLNLEVIQAGMAPLAADLAYHNSLHAATAIMTTDTIPKEAAVEFELDGKVCHLGGIAKGSGMIHPNMATMLVFLTTDAAISSGLLQKALSTDVQSTFNMVSVDGDTSTNDMVVILANGMAGNTPITQESEDFAVFMKALNTVTMQLCKMLAGDGEGATHSKSLSRGKLIAAGCILIAGALAALWFLLPQPEKEPPLRREFPVSRQTITVGVDASGTIRSQQWGQFTPVAVKLMN